MCPLVEYVPTRFPHSEDILQGNFKPDYYLKHIQKDLRLAISMGDLANHPTPMAAAANEVSTLSDPGVCHPL